MQGPIYVATFNAVAVSAAQDVFELLTSANSRIAIIEVNIGQYSDAGDTESEMLGVRIIRGFTTSGSGGSTAAAVNMEVTGRAAETTVEINNTTLAQNGSSETLLSDAFNTQAGYLYKPRWDPMHGIDERPRIQRDTGTPTYTVVRITAPADGITLNGTIKWQELGR